MAIFYTLFFAAVALMLLVNAVLAVRLRSSVPVFYGIGLCFVAMIVWLSSEPAPIPPQRARWIGLVGGGAAVCAVFFWDRLLILQIHAPRARYLVFASGFAMALSGVAVAIGPQTLLPALTLAQQIASLSLLPVVACTAVLTMRRGFRPAIYSTVGFVLFLLLAAVYVAADQGLLAKDGPARHALVIGFFLDFVFFLLSLASRAAVPGLAGPATELETVRYAADREKDAPRYQRSKLEHINVSALEEQLRQCMEVERCYCDEDLSLDRLADMCGVGRHELSEYLNDRRGVNFNRYINDYRVAEVRARIEDQVEVRRTLLDIAFSAGFNSKTRFNAEFKRVTGCTPREYRERALAQS